MTNPLNWDDSYDRAWVRTEDPRVIGVIQRDTWDMSEPECCGDSLVKITGDRWVPTAEAVVCCRWCPEVKLAETYADTFNHYAQRHRRRDAEGLTRRYMEMFHGAVKFPEERDEEENVAIVGIDTAEREMWLGDWRAYFDGEVFGVGYLVDESWVGEVDDEVIDARMGEVEMECWGLYGEEYAAEVAQSMEFLGVELSPMLPTA